MAGVVPGPGRFGKVARILLDLAGPGREHEVTTRTYPWYGFDVPEDIAQAYAAHQAGAEQPSVGVRPAVVQAPDPDPDPDPEPQEHPVATPEPDMISDIPVSPRRAARTRRAASS